MGKFNVKKKNCEKCFELYTFQVNFLLSVSINFFRNSFGYKRKARNSVLENLF